MSIPWYGVLPEIIADIRTFEAETEGLLEEILGA